MERIRSNVAAWGVAIVLALSAFAVVWCAPTAPDAFAAEAQAQSSFSVAVSTETVALGDTGKLVCTVKGAESAGLTYQWQWRSSASGTWTNATATGSKTSTLSATVTAARANYQYRCVVTSGTETVTSDIISFSVKAADLSATASTSAVSAIGQTGTLVCTVSGLDGLAATYQWQYSTDNGSTWANASATGAKTAKMSAAVTAARTKYLYRCVVTSAGRTATTNAISFKVATSALTATAATTPVSAIGDTGVLTCTVTGLNGFTATYQWQYSTDNGSTWANASATGAKTAKMSAAVTKARLGYLYRCTVKSADGRMATTNNIAFQTSMAELKAAVSTTPVALGATGTLSCTLEGLGSATATYQWQYSSNGGSTWGNSSGDSAKTANFSAAVTAARASYLYRCKVTASDGRSVISDSIAFDTSGAVITATATTTPVAIGMTGTLTCEVSGLTAGQVPTYQWQYSSNNGTNWYNSSGDSAKTAAFSATVTTARAGYLYRCVVKAPDGRSATTNTIKFDTSAAALAAKVSTTPVAAGATGTLTCTVENLGTATATYQWQYSSNGGSTWGNSSGDSAKTANFSAAVTAARASYLYRCKVTASDGRSVTSDSIAFQTSSALTLNKSTASVNPSYYVSVTANQSATWEVADQTVAYVVPSSDGKSCQVYGSKPGETTITATAVDGGATASCAITVRGAALSSNALTFASGSSKTIDATSYAAGAPTWTVGNADIALIEPSADGMSCKVTGVSTGTTIVTATVTTDNAKTVKTTCKVTITSVETGNAYINAPIVPLYTDSACTTIAKRVLYMTEVEILSTSKGSGGGNIYKVKVVGDDTEYYLREFVGSSYLTYVKHDITSYTGNNEVQQALLKRALETMTQEDGTRYYHEHKDAALEPYFDTDGTWLFDCSGFSAYVYRTVMRQYVPVYTISAGVDEQSKTDVIFNEGYGDKEFKAKTIASYTDKLSSEDLLSRIEPGDILFFHTKTDVEDFEICDHTGIYLGNGDFIHAIDYNDNYKDADGNYVDYDESLSGVCIVPLNSYWQSCLISVKRFSGDITSFDDLEAYELDIPACVSLGSDGVALRSSMSFTSTTDNVIATLSRNTPVTIKFIDYCAGDTWAYVECDQDTAMVTGFLPFDRLSLDSISLSAEEITISNIGYYNMLYATCLGSDGIEWSVDDESVATIDADPDNPNDPTACAVKAVTSGVTTVTATNKATGDSLSCKVTVDAEWHLSPQTQTLSDIGTWNTVFMNYVPAGADIEWSSSDPDVATVELLNEDDVKTAKVVAVYPGTTTITATDKTTGDSISSQVTVDAEWKLISDTLEFGKSSAWNTVLMNYVPEGADIEWTTSNSKVAKVSLLNEGDPRVAKVTSGSAGTAIVTATNKTTGEKLECTVTVGVDWELSTDTLTLSEIGTWNTVFMNYVPLDADIEWTSSNPDIATVDLYVEGDPKTAKVVSVYPGTTTITATDKNTGASLSCEVVVDAEWKFISDTLDFAKSGTWNTVLMNYVPEGAEIEWASTDPAVARVSLLTEGDPRVAKVTSGAAGVSTITATNLSTGEVLSCTVTVGAEWRISPESQEIYGTGKWNTVFMNYVPEGATIEWESSDPSIVRVELLNEGDPKTAKVTSISPGIATITATDTATGKSLSSTVTVIDGWRLSPEKLEFTKAGAWNTISMNYVPADSDIVWTSSNTKVATVSLYSASSAKTAKVVSVAAGTATITAMDTKTGASISAEVTVDADWKLSPATQTISDIGKWNTVFMNYVPENADIEWTSSDESIATVGLLKEGDPKTAKVVAQGPGTVTITATDTTTGKSISAEVVVEVAWKMLATEKTIAEPGKFDTLNMNYVPEGANIVWSSSDTEVATVGLLTEGNYKTAKITAVYPGTATITATNTTTGETISCEVTVGTKWSMLSSMTIKEPGKSLTLSMNYVPEGDIEWSSADTSIATVALNEEGNYKTARVYGVYPGTTTITATNKTTGESISCEVTVGTVWSITKSTLSIAKIGYTNPVGVNYVPSAGVEWWTDDTSIATVVARAGYDNQQSVNIKAVSAGTTTVWVKNLETGEVRSCTVTCG